LGGWEDPEGERFIVREARKSMVVVEGEEEELMAFRAASSSLFLGCHLLLSPVHVFLSFHLPHSEQAKKRSKRKRD